MAWKKRVAPDNRALNSRYRMMSVLHTSIWNANPSTSFNSISAMNDAMYANKNLKNSTRPAYRHTAL